MDKTLQRKLALAGMAITYILLLIAGFWLIVLQNPGLGLLRFVLFGGWGILALIIVAALFFKAIPRQTPRKVF